MDVDPNKDEHTSPEMLADVENLLRSKYPIAIAETERTAKVLSPFAFFFPLIPKTRIETRIVIGRTITMLFEIDKTVAIASAPNEAWDNPSPIKEYLLKTRVTPRSAAHIETSMPQIKAYLTKG